LSALAPTQSSYGQVWTKLVGGLGWAKSFRMRVAVGMSPSPAAHETLVEVRYNAAVYRDISGSVLGVFAAGRHVSKQMQARRETAEQQARELDGLADLQRYERLTVGRELKMIELKKEIELLRKFVPEQRRELD